MLFDFSVWDPFLFKVNSDPKRSEDLLPEFNSRGVTVMQEIAAALMWGPVVAGDVYICR